MMIEEAEARWIAQFSSEHPITDSNFDELLDNYLNRLSGPDLLNFVVRLAENKLTDEAFWFLGMSLCGRIYSDHPVLISEIKSLTLADPNLAELFSVPEFSESLPAESNKFLSSLHNRFEAKTKKPV